MVITIVAGTFDGNGGRPSGYMDKMIGYAYDLGSHCSFNAWNGGKWEDLNNKFKDIVEYSDIICWFPDISNDCPKLVGEIKKINPKCILITSKNNRSGKYVHHDLVARALNTKSNLLLEFRDKGGLITGTLHDPLGNVFLSDEPDPKAIWDAVFKRANKLRGFSRAKSIQVGDVIEAPDEAEFFELIKAYADRFHELIHAVNSDRLLGNASFRCAKGFPGFKHQDKIFVSRRNIDKRFIGRDGFVAVNAKIEKDTITKVKYYGDVKPSVDTPIQLWLFDWYKDIKYILHSHTYIDNALFTHSVVPCGALEEFNEIIALAPDPDTSNFCINLKGHGSLVLAKDLDYLKNIPYIPRPLPEIQQL